MAWGSGPWGSVPWGSGAFPTLRAIFVAAIQENVVRVTFDRVVRYTNQFNPHDAANLKRWAMAADTNTRDDKGIPPHEVTPVLVRKPVYGDTYFLDVVTDRNMSSFPAVYTITMNELRGKDGSALVLQTVPFYATYRRVQVADPQFVFANRDIANPQVFSALTGLPQGTTSTSAQLGTFRNDATGDVAFDEGITSFKKRVIRRLITKRAGFAHLQSYGVGLPESIKQLARVGLRARLAADAEDQIRQEPETASAGVTINELAVGVYAYSVIVRMRTGQQLEFAVGVPGNA